MPVITLISGLILLFLGKKAIHIFACIAGFFLSYQIVPNIAPAISTSILYTVCIGTGAIFLILTKVVKKLFIIIIGFIGGGMILLSLTSLLHLSSNQTIPNWGLFLIGGILGVILAATIVDWTIMLLSAFFGAYLIISLVNLAPIFNLVFYLLLALLGFYIQYNNTHKKKVLKPTG